MIIELYKKQKRISKEKVKDFRGYKVSKFLYPTHEEVFISRKNKLVYVSKKGIVSDEEYHYDPNDTNINKIKKMITAY